MFDFDTPVSRSHYHTCRERTTPACIKSAGMPSFAASEADFRFAPVITQMLQTLAEDGMYQCHTADSEFTGHLCWWIKNSRKSSILPEWIVPSFGTIYSINFFIAHFLSEKEKIVILTPCFHKYKICAERNNRGIIEVPLILKDSHYTIDFSLLERAFADPGARMFILCNPHNPIGQVWNNQDVRRIAELAGKYHILIFSDEIFADTVYGTHHVPPIWELYPEGSISIISLHKAFCLTGSCQSNLIIPNKELRYKAVQIRDRQYFGYIETFSYCAVLHAYTPEGLAWLKAMNSYVENNISYMKSYCLHHLPSVKIIGGEGAFIVWIDLRSFFGTHEDQLLSFCRDKAFLDIIPGGVFGNNGKGFIRMCAASPRAYIEKGMHSLARAVQQFDPDSYQ